MKLSVKKRDNDAQQRFSQRSRVKARAVKCSARFTLMACLLGISIALMGFAGPSFSQPRPATTQQSGKQLVKHYRLDLADADWKYQGTRVQCQLSQVIPGFGQAIFQTKAGGESQFILKKWTGLKHEVPATLLAETQSWHAQPQQEVISTLQLAAGRQPIAFNTTMANHLNQLLSAGMFLTLSYHNAGKPVKATISAIRYNQRHQAYEQCIDNLLPKSDVAIRESEVFFPTQGARLSARTVAHLQMIVEYVREGLRYDEIIVSGHTDNQGRRGYNRHLARQRAAKVKAYLVAQGIPASKILVRSYSQKKPRYDNATEAGRQKNRRAEIEIREY